MTAEVAATTRSGSGWRRPLAALAGPAAIVAAVVVILAEYARAVPIASDIRGLWAPSFCYLGRTLRGGAIPTWDPHIVGGAPFAADPQPFGWLYLLPMALFTLLPCGVAISLMIWSLSIIAGLACYAFVRLEAGSRVAATAGGLVVSVLIAGSELFKSLPISGAVALGMLLLAALAWYLQAPSTSSRVLRSVVVGVVFSQIVAAHMSVGMMALPLVALYVLAKALPATRVARGDAREPGVAVGQRPPPNAALAAPRARLRHWVPTLALAGLACVLASVALLLPRALYLPDSTLGLGYGGMFETMRALTDSVPGNAATPVTHGRTAPLPWPLEYGTGPGSYAGATGVLLAGCALWSRRRRKLVGAMAAFGALCVLLPWTKVANLVAALPASSLTDFYLHQPHRLGYHLIIPIGVATAIGVETWLEAPPRRRGLLLLPGTAALALAVVVKGGPTALWLAAAGWVAAVVVLSLSPRRLPPVAIAVLLGVELVVSAVPVGVPLDNKRTPVPLLVDHGVQREVLPTAELYAPDRLARALMDGQGRYISVGGRRAVLFLHGANLFGLEYAGGYSSAQPLRYWTFLRAATGRYVHYNRAFLQEPPRPGDVFVELLDITRVVAPADEQVSGATAVLTHTALGEDYRLHVLDRAPQRASLVTDWRVVADQEQALGAVIAPGFDPLETVVLESEPRFGAATAVAGNEGADFEWIDDRSAHVAVTTRRPAMLLVRNTYQRGWQATIDGRPAAVMPANSVVQAVPVPAGTHTVELRYRDSSVTMGLWASVVSLLALLVIGLWLRRREAAAVPSARQGSVAGQTPSSSSRRRVTAHAPPEVFASTVWVNPLAGSCRLRNDTPASAPSSSTASPDSCSQNPRP